MANMFTWIWKQLPPGPFGDPTMWKQLPPRPFWDRSVFCLDLNLVNDTSSETYKVILFYKVGSQCLAQIYESNSGAWSSNNRLHASDILVARSHCAYFDGVLYRVVRNLETAPGLLAFRVEEGTLTEFEMPPINVEENLAGSTCWFVVKIC